MLGRIKINEGPGPKQVLTRESIRDGYVQRMAAHQARGGNPLTEEQLHKSRRDLLNQLGAGADVWVFGYGSLMWNPAFHFDESRIGKVFGFHRRFCLWSTLGRGSPENPGLMLGLDWGGCCRGMVLRIHPDAVESETDILWRREMVRGAYLPRWVRVHTSQGVVRAITFTINHSHDSYAGVQPEDRVVECIATASGRLGGCVDYLVNTVGRMRQLGIEDRNMVKLLALVEERRKNVTAQGNA
ncbi:MAG: gamma-glutamylcyclotransferase [Rhodospirillales bacterium]